MDTEYDTLYKIILIGDACVGKTAILQRLTRNEFDPRSKPTIGVGFGSKVFKIGPDTIKLQMWDTAGQERFRAVTNTYYRGSAGVIIVFDITDRVSFNNLDKWISEVKDKVYSSTDVPIYVLGNKADLNADRSVTTAEAKDYCNRHRISYVEVSAKEDSTNILRTIEEFATDIHSMRQNKTKPPVVLTATPTDKTTTTIVIDVTSDEVVEPNKKKCC